MDRANLPVFSVPASRRAFLGGIAGGAALLLAGCASRPEPAVTAPASPSPSAPAPELFPLRGTPVQGSAVLHPSIAAKIGNDVEARPQWGLDRADIVIEELVEGGLTRYVAVWHSDIPEELGPLRSIRPMDPDIISPFGGIVAYSGGQEIFVNQMRDTGLFNAIHGQADTDAFMYRSTKRKAPHNVVLRAEKLIEAHSDLAPPPAQFSYAVGEESPSATAGEPATRINATFSTSRRQSWAYSAEAGVYERSQQDKPDIGENDRVLSAQNVIVLRVNIDNRYEGVPMTMLEGTGEGRIATGGQSVAVTWSKATAKDPITLTLADGNPALLAPGNTWIELVPLISGAEVAFLSE